MYQGCKWRTVLAMTSQTAEELQGELLSKVAPQVHRRLV
jgi:hypothetical protein